VKAGRVLLAGSGAVAASAAVAHVLPAATTWLELRCRLTPSLAGIGHPDHVALTFDDGPDPSSTPVVLDVLDRLGWRATFFLLGSMVRPARSLAAEIARRGHEVAVHGDDHLSHLRLTAFAIRDDLARGKDVIASATGTEPVWFRPPYGTLSGGSLIAAHQLGLRTVLWTTWGRDWRPEATAATVATDVADGLRAGATVLLHDSDCTSAPGSWRAGAGALSRLADLFAARHLSVGPLGDHGIRGGVSSVDLPSPLCRSRCEEARRRTPPPAAP
jgi:peptidoglycan/xylan/chitin deacetylase (PgdA/CDA1 family)